MRQESHNPSHSDGISVLIVEDDELDRFLIQHALEHADIQFKYRFANCAEDAQDILEAGHRPHLIVSDLRMPGIGGFGFLKWLKGSENYRRIPAIIFSNSTDQADVDKAYEGYASSYLNKPIDGEGYKRFTSILNAYWVTENRLPT